MPPGERRRFMGRLNGLFHGVFAAESWTCSQAYYFGSVNSNPAHRVEIVDGTPIDEHDDLDEIWLGKPNTVPPDGGADRQSRSGPIDEAALLEEIVTGASYHTAAVRLLGRWARSGVPLKDARQSLADAMEAVFPPDRDVRWDTRFADIERCARDIYRRQAGGRAEDRCRAQAQSEHEPGPEQVGPQLATDAHGGSDPASRAPSGTATIAAGIAKVVQRFNKLYMVVNESGKAIVLQPGFDPILKRKRYDRLTTHDLHVLYMNELVAVGINKKGDEVLQSVDVVWLRHCRRRQFIHGITFDPTHTGNKPGILNLWQGFAVEPKPGDWSLLRAHMQHVICADNSVNFEYLMGWLARMFKRPAEQGEVAVVLKGGEGTGKGTLARAVKYIFGQHALAISNARHLVGNFNAHLRDCIFLFADEAFFAGDRGHIGVLKALITEPSLTVEAKFQNAVEGPNFLHVMMASNEEWVVPAAMDSRRFLVLEVTDQKANDHGYFSAIWAQMGAGGYEAMLFDMLAMDLTRFNVRAVPTTVGLQQQRKMSLPATEAWWFDCLQRGYVFKSKLGLEAYFSAWHEKVSTELLVTSYLEFARARGERRFLSREDLGKFFVELKATTCRPRIGVVGEHIADVTDPYGKTIRKAELVQGERPTGYRFGDLGAARAAFLKATELPVTWDDGNPDDDEARDGKSF